MVSPDRLAAAGVVAAALASKDFRTVLRDVKDRNGDHPVVVGLPSDSCRDVFDRVKAAGAAAYVAMVEEGHLTLLGCFVGRGPLPDVPEPEDCPVHDQTTLGMLVTYLRNYQPFVVCHEVREADLKVELVDGRGPQFAPA